MEWSYDGERVAFSSFGTVIGLPSEGALAIKNGSVSIQSEISKICKINPSTVRFSTSDRSRSFHIAMHFESDGTLAWT